MIFSISSNEIFFPDKIATIQELSKDINIPNNKVIYINNDLDYCERLICKIYLEKAALGKYCIFSFPDFDKLTKDEFAFYSLPAKEGCGLLLLDNIGKEFFRYNIESHYFNFLNLLDARNKNNCLTILNFTYPIKDYFSELAEILVLPKQKARVLFEGFLKFQR